MLRFDTIPEPVKTLPLHLAAVPLMREFALGGGTSLALRFGHRLSVDLDFSPFMSSLTRRFVRIWKSAL